MKKHGFIVCFLDILGFKRKLEAIGIDEIERRYDILTESVRNINYQYQILFPDPKLESPIWIKDINNYTLRFFYRVYIHYASDSIILWCDRNWEIYNHIETDDQVLEHQRWVKYPKPCDPFVELCNEIICKGLEVGLPLRGSISIGEGRFDFKTNKYIGQVVNDSTAAEKEHNLVGIAVTKNFLNQIFPKKYMIKTNHHIKDNENTLLSNLVLDWPDHWRKTRSFSVRDFLKADDFTEDSHKYICTLKLIQISETQENETIKEQENDCFEIYSDYFKKTDAFPLRLTNDNLTDLI
jgi:hypothetical protein